MSVRPYLCFAFAASLIGAAADAQTPHYSGAAVTGDSVTVDLSVLDRLGPPPSLPQLLRPGSVTPQSLRPPSELPEADPTARLQQPPSGAPKSSLNVPSPGGEGAPPKRPAPAPEPATARKPPPTAKKPAPKAAEPPPAPKQAPTPMAKKPPAPPPKAAEAKPSQPAPKPAEPAAKAAIKPSGTTEPAPAEAKAPPPKPAEETKPAPAKQVAAVPGEAFERDGGLTVTFAPGSSDLPDNAVDALDRLAEQLKSDPNQRIQLVGYARTQVESPSQARRLSLFRALSVRTHLMKKGVRSTRMDVRALGNKEDDGPPDRVDLVVPSGS